MANFVLLALIVATWGVVLIACRKISLFPIFPVVPIVAFGAGLLMNEWIEWLGTWVAIALHVGLGAVGAANTRAPKDRQ